MDDELIEEDPATATLNYHYAPISDDNDSIGTESTSDSASRTQVYASESNQETTNSDTDAATVGSESPQLNEIELIDIQECAPQHQDHASDQEPAAKKQKLEASADDEEGTLCNICFDHWSQSGEHRISALKCGHLFGYSCILRWLNNNKTCPQCKSKAKKRDLRFIYANKLIAIDNSELTRMELLLDVVTCEKKKIEAELTKSISKQHMLQEQMEWYKLQLHEFRKGINGMGKPSFTQIETKKLVVNYKDGYHVCQEQTGTARIMDYMVDKCFLVVSLKSPYTSFPGYGVRMYHGDTFMAYCYIPLHKNVIRDLKLQQETARLLSVSLDKTAAITNLYTNETIVKCPCDDMLWSCCWDAVNPNVFHVGGQQGAVKSFDVRYVNNDPLETYQFEGDMSPVVSVASLPYSPGSALPLGGLIACKLNSLWGIEKTQSGQMKRHLLPIEGPFVSMTYNSLDEQLLISARPNAREPATMRHIVCALDKESDVLKLNRVHTFIGQRLQKQLFRSCFSELHESPYAATPDGNQVQVWDCKTGAQATTLKNYSALPVIDVLPLNNKNGSHLVTLTEKKFEIFHLAN